MENTLLYRSGDVFLTGKLKYFLDIVLVGDYESGWYISNWSLMHMISGMIVGSIFRENRNRYLYGLVIHTLWELWQIYIGMSNAHKKLSGKSGLSDTVVDTLFFLLGMKIIEYKS
jgi:hypothetical protein